MKILPLTFLAAAAAIASSANADTMYKCTDPNGKVTYSDQPCTGKSKAATLKVRASQASVAKEDDVDDEWGSQQSRKPQETELERLRRADADFQQRRAKREASEAEEANALATENRRANQLAEGLKAKSIDPKQTITLSLPTRSQLQREAKEREEQQKRRREALLPSIH